MSFDTKALRLTLVASTIVAYLSSNSIAGLVGFWDFEGTVADQSRKHLDGTLVGDASYDDDVPADIASTKSILLDGDGDWIGLGNPSTLNFTSNDWTVAGWSKTTRTGLGDENEGTIFGNGGDWQGGIRYTLVLSEGNREGVPTLVIDDNAAPPGTSFNKQVLVAKTAVNDGVWHHVAGVRDAGELRIYVDGKFEGRIQFNPSYDLTGIDQHPAYIGAIVDNRDSTVFKNFDGRLDDVAVWDYALKPHLIERLAAGALSPLAIPEPSSFALTFTAAALVALLGMGMGQKRSSRTGLNHLLGRPETEKTTRSGSKTPCHHSTAGIRRSKIRF